MRIRFKVDAWVLGCIPVAAALSGCFSEPNVVGVGYIEDELSDEACTPKKNGGVPSKCGVWVSSTLGRDNNAGVPGAPFKTISRALQFSPDRGRRIYLCAQTFDEAVLVPGGHTLFGGLDCGDDWVWKGDEKKTTLTAPEGETPLSFDNGVGVAVIEDLHVIARSIPATHTELAGRSAIAANSSGVPVDFRRCILEAGDGAPGASSTAFADEAAEKGMSGNFGNAACTSATVAGGVPVNNTCGTPDDRSDDSRGGTGGTGRVESGGDGTGGVPADTMNGGKGETSARRCTAGQVGADGVDGMPGAGATGFGSLFLDGYTGPLAGDGTPGTRGQGGGGGGGAKGGTDTLMCPFSNAAGGAGGGSGGAGGCGGFGGRGGGAGGVSIALFAGSAVIDLNDVVLKTGRGGDGGDGGVGQVGGEGGDGGPAGTRGKATALNAACPGGRGGRGGQGGRGGGGLGGHSIAIAYAVIEPSLTNTTIEVGEAGIGGRGASRAYDGADGVAAEIYDIDQQFGQ
ncbi:PGRS family protein [Sorangium sp. So ce1000]|uniref:PGRS family protein n=1 Tax=Sorangium sp. So ce1000 TaxID=3133325 RepID=UPI003F604114